LWDVEAPTFSLDGRLTDGGVAVSLTYRSLFTPRKIPGTHFCERLSLSQGLSAAGRIRSIDKSNDLIANRTCDLPACGLMSQPTKTRQETILTFYKFLAAASLFFCDK
jgi:hypothetical protein